MGWGVISHSVTPGFSRGLAWPHALSMLDGRIPAQGRDDRLKARNACLAPHPLLHLPKI
jgi:hypothetical protein